jgi:lipoprotein NlpI
MGVTDTQSYSLVIRDAFYDTLANREPFFANHFKRKTKMVPIMPEQVPFLGVYIIDETMTPDGDGNAGEVAFIHTLRIGFSVIVANNDQDAAEREIDTSFWRIMNRLWTDAHVMNVMNTYNPDDGSMNGDNTRIESISRGVRRHQFGTNQLNNQTPLAELQYDVSCVYRTYWPPVVYDDLNEIDVTTQLNANAIEVQSKYFFNLPPSKEKRNG